MADIPAYGVKDFERDLSGMQPRLVDIWLIPPLVMYAAWKSRDLGRWTRRVLFTAGVYMIYRNWTNYKTSLASLAAIGSSAPAVGATATTTEGSNAPDQTQGT